MAIDTTLTHYIISALRARSGAVTDYDIAVELGRLPGTKQCDAVAEACRSLAARGVITYGDRATWHPKRQATDRTLAKRKVMILVKDPGDAGVIVRKKRRKSLDERIDMLAEHGPCTLEMLSERTGTDRESWERRISKLLAADHVHRCGWELSASGCFVGIYAAGPGESVPRPRKTRAQIKAFRATKKPQKSAPQKPKKATRPAPTQTHQRNEILPADRKSTTRAHDAEQSYYASLWPRVPSIFHLGAALNGR